MTQVNMLEAKTNLSKMVGELENYEEDSFIIARKGKPVAQLTRIATQPAGRTLGLGEGLYAFPDDFDEQFVALDAEVEGLFEVLS